MTRKKKVKKILADFLKERILLKDELPTISDMNKLISYWNNTSSGSEPQKLIEQRMAEILEDELPIISNMNKLISYWNNASSDSGLEKLIEQRMAEVLPTISDMNKLISYRNNASSDSGLEKLIEQRMAEILEELVTDNIEDIPDWFLKIAQDKISIGNFLLERFIIKAKDIFKKI